MKKKFLGLMLLVSTIAFSYSEKVVKVYSKSMKKDIDVTVVLPDSYDKNMKFPTVYTLHGWSGNNTNFPQKLEIGKYADKYDIIYVSPDGNYDSWYVDSDVKKNSNYDTFVSKELVEYIDSNYKTDARREQRGITGLSMGGFGALYLGINHKDVYGNIASMSGGVDVYSFQGNWGINKVINKDWEKYNIKDLAHQLIWAKTNIWIDCGVDDFFIEANRDLHKKLIDLNIPHIYSERPGAHSWVYWKESIMYQSMFFNNNFENNK